MQRSITLLYFAWVRERVGKSSEVITLPADIATVADLVEWLRKRGPEYGEAFAKPAMIRAAVDQVHVKPSEPIGAAREIAFFPPVTGG